MSYEMLIGLQVTDQTSYQAYREGMIPILKTYGGGFRYDFTVEKVLKTESTHPINRLFAIYFKDSSAKDAFFANEDYKRVRATYFEPAVAGVRVISEYPMT